MTDTATQTKKGAQHITDAEFDELIKSAGMPIFIDFFAEWCGPCKLAAPIVDKLADEFGGKVKIVKMDVDENPATSKKFGVMSIPTVILFKADGTESERKVGFPGEQGYRQLLAKVLPAA